MIRHRFLAAVILPAVLACVLTLPSSPARAWTRPAPGIRDRQLIRGVSPGPVVSRLVRDLVRCCQPRGTGGKPVETLVGGPYWTPEQAAAYLDAPADAGLLARVAAHVRLASRRGTDGRPRYEAAELIALHMAMLPELARWQAENATAGPELAGTAC